jgi:hypothetical protein
MGDEQQRQVHALFQFGEEIDNLLLDGDVKRGDTFIRDDEARVDRKRPGNASVLLPLPVSPTMPTVSPGMTRKLTPLTALILFRPPRKIDPPASNRT